jgi:DNA polymerase III delta prime subunit
MDFIKDQFLWVEKYRPLKIEDCILPDNIKGYFREFKEKGEIPNIILNGRPGVGKTSVAIALLEEMGREFIKINGSLRNGIDAVRNDILDFSSTVSFNSGRKYILLDEGDGMNNNAQDALKSLIEEFASNAGFIITCNDKNRLNTAFHSRFITIDFNITSEDFPIVGKAFNNRLMEILNHENIPFDPNVLAKIIRRYFPDFRKTLNHLQGYAIKNKEISSGILAVPTSDSKFIELISSLKSKNWRDMRKWVGENIDIVQDFPIFSRRLLKILDGMVKESSLPTYTVLSAEYDYRQAFVMDKETNFVAFLSQVMSDMEFK